jgi:hypothetical protein
MLLYKSSHAAVYMCPHTTVYAPCSHAAVMRSAASDAATAKVLFVLNAAVMRSAASDAATAKGTFVPRQQRYFRACSLMLR